MKKIKYFLLATRPYTLPASSVPVIIGSTLANYQNGRIDILIFLITLVCSLLLQIISNYINEIFDFKKGVDTPERVGPRRFVASGIISVELMRNVTIVLVVFVLGLGIILVEYSGIFILIVGILSLCFAYLYTGGPFPLSYKGLGEIFVMTFFGLVPVCGSFYIQTGNISTICLISSFAPGFIAVNILGVNNIRDLETDEKAGKITLAIKIGKKSAQMLYVILNIFTLLLSTLIFIITKSLWNLLPLAILPFCILLCSQIYKKSGKELNLVLAGTGKLLLLFGLLVSLGFLLSYNNLR